MADLDAFRYLNAADACAPRFNRATAHVLLWLGVHASHKEGGKIWQSVDEIADSSGESPTAVDRAFAAFKKAGVIEAEKPRFGFPTERWLSLSRMRELRCLVLLGNQRKIWARLSRRFAVQVPYSVTDTPLLWLNLPTKSIFAVLEWYLGKLEGKRMVCTV
jgi:hypothetical protein